MNKVDELVAKVGETLRTHLNGLHSEYAIYKQTHDAILALPAVQSAIREGCTRANPQEFNNEYTKTDIKSIDVYLATIEALKLELQNVKLENDALRLQLSTSSPSSNITLVIEEKAIILNEHEYERAEEDDDDNDNDEKMVGEKEPAEEKHHQEAEQEEDEEQEPEEAEQEEEEEQEPEEAEQEEDEEQEPEEAEQEEEEEEAEQEEEEEQEPEEAEQEEEEEEAEQEEESEEDQEPEEEEVEVIEIQIKGKTYFTTNETSGVIYECLADGDIGGEVGEFKNGKPVFKSNQTKK
jgi:DNA polymerase III gamma/tau subunit